MKENILIVGGDSQIGQALAERLGGDGFEVTGTSRREDPASVGVETLHLDLANLDEPLCLPRAYAVAVICAAITNIKYCQSNPDESGRVNVAATLRLARQLMGPGCFVVFLSSSQVFDGRRPRVAPGEAPSPATVYGRQKAEVEGELAKGSGNCAIVRLTKVISDRFPLLRQWEEALRQGQAIRPFSDYVCSLLALDQVAAGLAQIAGGRRRGLWQFSAPDDVSYAAMAQQWAALRGFDPGLVRPVGARAGGFDGFLPQNTTLDATLTERELNLTFRPSLKVLERIFHHAAR
jgi:dTDP-4-dehydrorhamnose reductase